MIDKSQLSKLMSLLVLFTVMWVRSYLQEHGQLKGPCVTGKPTLAWITTQKSYMPGAPFRT